MTTAAYLGIEDRPATAGFPCPHCWAFPYDSAEDLAEHVLTCTGSGRVVRPEAPAAPAAQIPADRASEKQTGFIRALLAEREGIMEAEVVRNVLNDFREKDGYIRKDLASQIIKALLAISKPRTEARTSTPPAAPDVPAGRYAIREDDGRVRFFQVRRPEEGKWAGWTFVSEQAGSDLFPVRGERAKNVLADLAENPAEASYLYGREIGECGVCSRTLTDEDSRARGIGPVCAGKLGW